MSPERRRCLSTSMNPGLRTIVDVAFAVLECPQLRCPLRRAARRAGCEARRG